MTSNTVFADDFLCLFYPPACEPETITETTSFLCMLDPTSTSCNLEVDKNITITHTPVSVDGITGLPTQNIVTKVAGERLRVIVKPKENFKGVIKVDGLVVATGGINSVIRYKHTVENDSIIETSYIP